MQYLKNNVKIINIVIICFGLLIPLLLFLNRFLIPDISFDSINYHLYLGFKGINEANNRYEFYPTGMHNFSTILDIPGYVLFKLFGYRLGSIVSLISTYLCIFFLYKTLVLYYKWSKCLEKWWFGILFVSSFLSFESFLQISTYYIDNEVAFLMMGSIYFLLRYGKYIILKDLYISTIFASVFVLGKMTSWYILVPYFMYLIYVVQTRKDYFLKKKFGTIVSSIIIVIALVVPWLLKNYIETKNPVYPFYNGIFLSEYSNTKYNFSQIIFGGRNLIEKVFWGVTSIKNPVRLGEVHDLFTDYKINIYYVFGIFAFIWALFKKNNFIMIASGFYLIMFLCWSLTFGYLRYALILEYFGGLLIIYFFLENKRPMKYILLIPVIFILILQSKRVINLSLAYDISFRPGFYYNRISYPKEINNFNNNLIKSKLDIKADVYLNCAIPGMTWYVLSEYNNLPVMNIDSRAYSDLTDNGKYIDTVSENIKNALKNKNKMSFVTIASKDGLENTYKDCVDNLRKRDFKITDEDEIDNFIGYKGQKLVYIFGEYSL